MSVAGASPALQAEAVAPGQVEILGPSDTLCDGISVDAVLIRTPAELPPPEAPSAVGAPSPSVLEVAPRDAAARWLVQEGVSKSDMQEVAIRENLVSSVTELGD